MIFDPVTGICTNCGKHKATTRWIGEGGSLALSHGVYELWCECCCLKAQLEYAEKSAASIPDLKRKLTEVQCEEESPTIKAE